MNVVILRITEKKPSVERLMKSGFFYPLFSNITDQEMDAHPESVDIRDWCKLEKEKQELLRKLREGRRGVCNLYFPLLKMA